MAKHYLGLYWLLLLALVVPLGLSGCTNGVGAQAILSNALSNIATLNTYKYTQTSQEVLTVTSKTGQGYIISRGNSTASLNIINREMQRTLQSSLDQTGQLVTRYLTSYTYFMDGWFYGKASSPNDSGQWMKKELTQDAWMISNQIGRDADALKSAHKITKAGVEKVDGVDCYVIQFTPEMDTLTKSYLADNLNGLVDINGVDWSKILKSYSIREWISKDKYLPVKNQTNISLKMERQDVGNTLLNMDSMTVTFTCSTTYSDYNEPVNIQLPVDALNAEETSF